MPRCGQISRRANGSPCRLRQSTSGNPSSVWACMWPGRTWEAARAGYQKPNRGGLGDGRDPISSEESMPHDNDIGWKGQETSAEIARSILTVLPGLCYKTHDSFPGARIFLRVPVRGSGALDGKFLFLYNGVFV